MDVPGILRRAVALLARPAETWRAIADEPGEAARSCVPHLIAMAGFAVVSLTAFTVLLRMRLGPLGGWLTRALGVTPAAVLLLVAGVWLLAVAARLLAPSFESSPDRGAALRLAVFGTTPTFLATALFLLDALALRASFHYVAVLGGAAGSFYLFHQGAGAVAGTPPARRAGFAGALALVWLALSAVALVGPRQVL